MRVELVGNLVDQSGACDTEAVLNVKSDVVMMRKCVQHGCQEDPHLIRKWPNQALA